ncbi:hypothetical protein FX016_23080 [Cupriavidus gilardii]|nr:hypothetical protein FX016_23080 [Cupriavidus gilardii]
MQRDPKEGVALAAIPAKETTEGRFSGTGGGLGFGTGGLGVFVGGVSGTTRTQTQRARDFQGPEKAGFPWLSLYGPILAALGFAFVFSVAVGFVGHVADTGPRLSSGPVANIAAVANRIVSVVPTLVVIGVFAYIVYFMLFAVPSRRAVAEEQAKAEEAAHAGRMEVYHRLRYVEADHIVFDPATGREVPATAQAIRRLLDELAAR